MSVMRCSRCGKMVDTDEEYFDFKDKYCEGCIYDLMQEERIEE